MFFKNILTSEVLVLGKSILHFSHVKILFRCIVYYFNTWCYYVQAVRMIAVRVYQTQHLEFSVLGSGVSMKAYHDIYKVFLIVKCMGLENITTLTIFYSFPYQPMKSLFSMKFSIILLKIRKVP